MAILTGRELPWITTALFVLGGITGMLLGRRLTARLAGQVLQQVFAVGILLMGSAMLAEYYLGEFSTL